MQLPKREVLRVLRDRGIAPEALDPDGLLPEWVDTDRDARALEQLGIARGDLLKQYGGDAGLAVVRRHGALAEDTTTTSERRSGPHATGAPTSKRTRQEMATLDDDTQPMIGRRVVDRHNSKIGTISDVYIDDETGQPTWLTVNTGLFGTKVHFVPLALAESYGDDIIVRYDEDLVKDAPSVEPDGVLDPAEEAELYAHYGFPPAGGNRDAMARRSGDDDSSGPATDEAMTRSEEQLVVSTPTRRAGTARLRKWIETEDVEIRVPVRREKARIVTEPVTGSNRDQALAGEDLTTGEHEVVLNEEVVDVDKRVVPKERVRLETETETDEVALGDTVRKERIDFEHGDVDRRRTDR